MNDEGRSRVRELEEQGWVEQFIASEPRLSEAVELYRESGFEVHLEPLPKGRKCEFRAGPQDEEQEECRVCFKGHEALYKIIFTRRPKGVR